MAGGLAEREGFGGGAPTLMQQERNPSGNKWLRPLPLRRIFRLVWWTLCTLTLMTMPFAVWQFNRQGFDTYYQAWFVAGIFVAMAMPISMYELAMHTEYYTRPRLQRHVIRILWMVPIYALDAWLALRFKDAREYLHPIRECYEAFVIYSFFAYLTAYLEEELGNVEEHLMQKPPMAPLPIIGRFIKPYPMGPQFLWECKKGVLNYVVLRPVCTLLALVTDQYGLYGQGHFNPRQSFVYLSTITSVAQGWALYCLVMFYNAMHEELSPIRPLSKFLCIKAIVFLTFWQGIVLSALVAFGVIKSDPWSSYDVHDVASGIQDFLICIEMFVAALAQAYAFPPADYMRDLSVDSSKRGFLTNVRYMFDLSDVVTDVQEVVGDHVAVATHTVVTVPKKAVKGIVRTPHTIMHMFSPGSGSNGRTRSNASSVRLLDHDNDDEEGRGTLLGATDEEGHELVHQPSFPLGSQSLGEPSGSLASLGGVQPSGSFGRGASGSHLAVGEPSGSLPIASSARDVAASTSGGPATSAAYLPRTHSAGAVQDGDGTSGGTAGSTSEGTTGGTGSVYSSLAALVTISGGTASGRANNTSGVGSNGNGQRPTRSTRNYGSSGDGARSGGRRADGNAGSSRVPASVSEAFEGGYQKLGGSGRGQGAHD